MKDINELFSDYTPNWCKKNHLPKECLKKSKYWEKAWQDFMQDILVPDYENRKTEFLNIQLLKTTNKDIIEEQEEEPSNSWEEIQKYLN